MGNIYPISLCPEISQRNLALFYPHCCGLDINKASVTACVLVMEGAKRHKTVRRFGTATAQIQELADWLDGFGVQQVAMEATGVYWKPIWNLLEDRFELLLVNAQHIKNVRGRKTDIEDCEWTGFCGQRCFRPIWAPHLVRTRDR